MSKNKKEKKDLDGWIEVFIIDPITSIFVKPLSSYFSKNPLIYTSISFLLSISSSILVLNGYYALAGISYFWGIIFDGLDGKVARYNNNKVLIHGVLDGTTDMIKNSILILVLGYVFNDYYFMFLLFLVIFLFYEFTYSMRLDLKIRYFSKDIVIKNYSMHSLKRNYENQIQKLNSSFISFLLKIYNFLFNITSKVRTYPYPTIIDGEFLLFVVFLLTQNIIFLYLAVLFLIPDTLISLFLTLLLTIRADQKKNENSI